MVHAVHPKTDCPHVAALAVSHLEDIANEHFQPDRVRSETCLRCGGEENWLCFHCGVCFCSRYEQGHMLAHFEEETHREHCVVFSLSDGSFWCYQCDSYITNPVLDVLRRQFGRAKFPEEDSERDTAERTVFTRDALVQGLREKCFSRVAVLTGAGISVAAGIPDFRTPGTGLYAKVASLGLPRPEAIFSLDFFVQNPRPFSSIAKQFLLAHEEIRPVNAHYFIKTLHDEEQLLLNYTQNIDGLELQAGLPPEKLVQAHGHMRSAHCHACGAAAPIEDFLAACEREEPLPCAQCDAGWVKPDIVFFGESLPEDFHDNFHRITEADLVIVMGTSLKVYPFTFLLSNVDESVPLVLINRINPGLERDNFLFLAGDIEDILKGIMSELSWPVV